MAALTLAHPGPFCKIEACLPAASIFGRLDQSEWSSEDEWVINARKTLNKININKAACQNIKCQGQILCIGKWDDGAEVSSSW